MQALYRKYRSTTLNEVVGQDHVTTTLKRALEKGSISHAYLFTGPKGVGKTSTARILAHEINNLPYTSEDFNIDIIEIDAASNRRIDEIRDIRDKVAIAPSLTKYKVYIIDEVHMLTKEAFNALLKTLEEPPQHVVFILATTELHKLPETIVSRTQRFHFKPITKEATVAHLKHIAKKEHIDIDTAALELISEHSEGSFRDAINLLDQVSKYTDNITTETIEDVLGIAPRSKLESLLLAVENRSINDMLHIIESLLDAGVPAPTVAISLSRLVKEHIINSTNQSKTADLVRLIHSLLEVPSAYDPTLKLETLLIDFCTVGNEHHRPKDVAIATTSISEPATRSIASRKEEQPKAESESQHIVTQALESAVPIKPAATSPDSDHKTETIKNIEDSTNDLLAIWQNILKTIKSHNNTLYGVLRLAEVRLTDKKQLILAFCFALHAKKANTNEVKEIILESLQHTVYSEYSLEISVDKNAKATLPDSISGVTIKKQTTERPVDVPKNITDIFGGGEVM